jgi:O-antigen ligase
MSLLNRENWTRGFTALLFLFPSLILLRAGSYNLTAGLLLLSTLAFCVVHRHELRLEKEDRWFFAFLFSYPLILLLAVVVQGGKWSALDYPWRALALIPIVLSLRTLKAKISLPQAWALGWIVGSIGAGAIAAYLVFWQGWLRVGSQITNEIPYGQIAAVMALGCLLLLGQRRAVWQSLLCVVAGLAALFALASSGTRGAWLGFGFALLCCGILAIRWNWRRIMAALIGVTMVMAYLQTFAPVQTRLDSLQSEIQSYQSGNSYTSLGVRLDLWLQSYELARPQPLLGIGPGNFKTALAPKIAAKPYLAEFSHAHSQYFDTLANAGFVGLAALLLSFFGPLYLFWRKVQRCTGWARSYALQGCGLIICSMVASLTQPLYAHNISVIFYLICLSVC